MISKESMKYIVSDLIQYAKLSIGRTTKTEEDRKYMERLMQIAIYGKIAIHRKSRKGNWKKTLNLRVKCNRNDGWRI